MDAAATPFRLADLSVVWALLDVPETDANAIRVGQAAVVETGGGRSMRHAGRVVNIADVVDEQTRTVKVRVEIPNAQRHFRAGMFVTARITTGATGAPALMVPKTAVFVMDEGPVVFVDGPDGIRARPVEVGPETGGWVPIRSGLAAGERVVAEGGFALKAQLVKAKLGEE